MEFINWMCVCDFTEQHDEILCHFDMQNHQNSIPREIPFLDLDLEDLQVKISHMCHFFPDTWLQHYFPE